MSCRRRSTARWRSTPAAGRASPRRSRRWCGPTRSRTALVLTLMITQAFLYNAVFFNQGLQLTTFFGVAPGDRRALHLSVRDRQLLGRARPRALLRRRRPQEDDRGMLPAQRRADGAEHRALLEPRARRDVADAAVVGDVLLRQRRRERRVPHRQRDLPARDARRRDRVRLRGRHADRRRGRAADLRRADRHAAARDARARMGHRRGAHDRGRHRRAAARRRRGAQVARGDRGAADGRRDGGRTA